MWRITSAGPFDHILLRQHTTIPKFGVNSGSYTCYVVCQIEVVFRVIIKISGILSYLIFINILVGMSLKWIGVRWKIKIVEQAIILWKWSLYRCIQRNPTRLSSFKRRMRGVLLLWKHTISFGTYLGHKEFLCICWGCLSNCTRIISKSMANKIIRTIRFYAKVGFVR